MGAEAKLKTSVVLEKICSAKNFLTNESISEPLDWRFIGSPFVFI